MLIKIKMKTPKIAAKAVEKAKKAQGIMAEFKEFLAEYKILGIAAGLVIGSAVTAVTQSLVVGLITPLLQLMIPADAFKSMYYEVNGVKFQFGMVVNSLINFIVVALLFFVFVKFFMKQEKVAKI